MKDHLGHEFEEQHQKHLPTGRTSIIILVIAAAIVGGVLLYMSYTTK